MSEPSEEDFFERDEEVEQMVFGKEDPSLTKKPKRAEPAPPRPLPKKRNTMTPHEKWIPGKERPVKKKRSFAPVLYAIILVATLSFIYWLVTSVMELYVL